MARYQKNRLAVRMFSRLMKFSGWLQAIPDKLMPPPFRLLQISSAFWQSRALYVAARLDIATALGDERLAAEAIAERVGARPDATWRLLRMLAAMGIFAEVAPRVFANNRLSAHLRADHPKSVRDLVLMHNSPEMSRPWYESLEQGVRNGEVPFRLAHGEELFAYMDGHPEFDALFSRAMDAVEALIGDSYATDFDWGRFARVVDVGGSKGSKALSILKRHPALTALVFDRGQVVRDAAAYWQGREDEALLARMRFEAGDVLEAVPPGRDGDVYLLSAVLHGFDDEACVRALQNVAAACAGIDARIALMELVMPETGADAASASFDMQLLMGTRGRERTLAEWRGLFAQGGLVLEEVVGLRSFGSIIVARPAG